MITPFVLKDHFLTLNLYLSQYEMEPVTEASIPAMGYVYHHNGAPVAFIFIRRIEGGTAFMDGLVVHPLLRGETRNNAANALMEHSTKEAQAVGIKGLICTCLNTAPIERAKKHGFVLSPHALLVKGI